MKHIYVASPYTKGDKEYNVMRQISAGHLLMDKGFVPVLPLLSHFMHLRRSRPYEDWMALDISLLGRCDALLRLAGESPGADSEVAYARRHHIPVFYTFRDLFYYFPAKRERANRLARDTEAAIDRGLISGSPY
jgi:nucleoside 2-deoxyribosyltransferase